MKKIFVLSCFAVMAAMTACTAKGQDEAAQSGAGAATGNTPAAVTVSRNAEYPMQGLTSVIEEDNEAVRLDPDAAERASGGTETARADTPAGAIEAMALNRGDVPSAEGGDDEVIEEFDLTPALSRKLDEASVLRGTASDAKEDYDRAAADFNEAVRPDSNFASAYDLRGNAYRIRGDNDRAIAEFSEAVRLDPNDTYAYHGRGLAYYNKKEYARARADWEKVLQIDPNDANARKNLAMIREMGY
jgi:tetratricopeptide (TPR) repeat protein